MSVVGLEAGVELVIVTKPCHHTIHEHHTTPAQSMAVGRSAQRLHRASTTVASIVARVASQVAISTVGTSTRRWLC